MSKQQELRILRKFSRKEIGDFVYGYSVLPFSASLRQYASDNKLSIDTFKSMIAVSISHCIVDNNTVDILEQKAVLAAYKHFDDIQALSIQSVKKQYDGLRKQRKSFSFTDEEAIQLIIKYAFSPFPKREFCKREGITISLFDRTFLTGISTCLVADDIVSALQIKSILHTYDHSAVTSLYQKLWLTRKEYQETHQNT